MRALTTFPAVIGGAASSASGVAIGCVLPLELDGARIRGDYSHRRTSALDAEVTASRPTSCTRGSRAYVGLQTSTCSGGLARVASVTCRRPTRCILGALTAACPTCRPLDELPTGVMAVNLVCPLQWTRVLTCLQELQHPTLPRRLLRTGHRLRHQGLLRPTPLCWTRARRLTRMTRTGRASILAGRCGCCTHRTWVWCGAPYGAYMLGSGTLLRGGLWNCCDEQELHLLLYGWYRTSWRPAVPAGCGRGRPPRR